MVINASSRRRVGLNLVYLVPGQTGGMETYARSLIKAMLPKLESYRIELTGFTCREAGGSWIQELIPTVELPVSSARREQWMFGEQLLLPRAARRSGIELLHSFANTAPFTGRFKRLLTVHDLNYHVLPEAHSSVNRWGMQGLVPLSVRFSHGIIAISNNTANDLTDILGTAPGKIKTVLSGIDRPSTLDFDTEAVRAELGLGSRRVLLSLSAKKPHKNLLRLIEALAAVPVVRRPLLVLPGYSTAHEAELKRRVTELGLEQDVLFFGWLSGLQVEALYRIADAFIFPSLYEGFGLPVLEAMARGLPVACSDRGSLGEVAGDAALRFDPESTQAVTAAIETVMADEWPQRDLLIQRGLERVELFSWERAATATLDAYKALLPYS